MFLPRALRGGEMRNLDFGIQQQLFNFFSVLLLVVRALHIEWNNGNAVRVFPLS
jgi:hypothetical protein